jgi:hypothetical protein
MLKKQKSTYLMLVAFLQLTGCDLDPQEAAILHRSAYEQAQKKGTESFRGELDATFITFLLAQPHGGTIRLESGGGRANIAIEAAKIVAAKNLTVEMNGLCASACLDILLPTFASIQSGPNALFAAHGNPVSNLENAAKNFNMDNRANVDCLRQAIELKSLWNAQSTNFALLDELTRKTEIVSMVQDSGYCPRARRRFAYYILSSEEMKLVFGDKFKGTACGDSKTCLQQAETFFGKKIIAAQYQSPPVLRPAQ